MERIEDCITFLTGKAAQQMARRARERLAAHGITPVQYAVLSVLWERDGQSGAALSARLVIDSATLTGILDRLEAANAVTRRADKADRRVNRVYLTAQGRALQASLMTVFQDINREVDQQLGNRAAAFRAMLRKLSEIDT